MGKPMCHHLMKNGYEMSIYARNKSKVEDTLALGAKFLSIEEIGSSCDVVFIMLGYPHDVKEVALGETGLINYMKSGSILVDHTTSTPALAKEIYEKYKAKGIEVVDAPVSGGDVGAKNGTLVVMCGGENEVFEKAEKVMKHYSSTIRLMGGAGAGQNTKICNQINIAGCIIGTVESMLFAQKAGLDPLSMIEAIEGGSAASFCLKVLGRRMVKRDFDPGFIVEHFVKDMGIALEEANALKLYLPGLSLVRQLYQILVSQGGSRLGTQGLLLALEKLNNMGPADTVNQEQAL